MTEQFTLERDGHDQPWGFRLQGGVDVGLPLSILRVLVGTPAEAVMKKGDIVSKISQTGTHNLSHQQAVDLFNNAGNQISVTVKRGAVPSTTSQPSISSLQASVAIKQQQQQQAAISAVSAGGDPSQSPQVAALPRTIFVLKSDLPPPVKAPTVGKDELSIRNQPYRTVPLVQPSIKTFNELGSGSYSHLKLQEDICTRDREPQLVPVSSAQANAIKANDLIMKQKTQQVVVEAASDHQRGLRSPLPPPQQQLAAAGPIGGPAPLQLPPSPTLPPNYKPPQAAPAKAPAPQPPKTNIASNVAAAAPYSSNPTTGKDHAAKPSPTGMINPVNKPPKNLPFSALSLKYNPEQSATWQAINEEENCNLISEHGPTESKVYSI